MTLFKVDYSMNPIADNYFLDAPKWQEELKHLRKIALATQLTETIKWGVPLKKLMEQNALKEPSKIILLSSNT